jgi:hypothetical protein
MHETRVNSRKFTAPTPEHFFAAQISATAHDSAVLYGGALGKEKSRGEKNKKEGRKVGGKIQTARFWVFFFGFN